MRILYLCHRIPFPPNKGDKIRAFHQIRAISALHEVDLFTLVDDPSDLDHREPLQAFCHELTVARLHPKLARIRSLPYLLTKTPLTIPYFYSAELAGAVRHALSRRSYDRIFVYCSAMAQYIEMETDIPVLMDLVDVDSDKWTQYAGFSNFPFSAVYRREGRTLREYERKACGRVACVLVSTEREARLARELVPGGHVETMPNGVDAEYFKPGPPVGAEDAVIFTGDMSYFPNQLAVAFFGREVLPLVRRELSGVRFLIVGRNPGPKVQELAEIEGVEVTGFVPDVREWLAKAQVAVAPFTIAAGIQNKILEAMAFGLPVVATSRAAQGLSPGVAEMVELGDTAAELAARVVVLLRNANLARRRGVDGRRRVVEDYSWSSALARLLKLVENPAGGCASQSAS